MKNKILKKIVGLFGYKIIDKKDFKNKRTISKITSLKIDLVLKNLFLNNNIKKIIQIGANDGQSFDELNKFIKKYKTQSILVEPIKEIFLKLKENYKEFENVNLQNLAISVDNEINSIFKVKENYTNLYDEHIKAISSFKKKHLLDHGVKEKHIISENVNKISIRELIENNNFNDLDLLYIDAEGYDGKIVKDFLKTNKSRPFIIFEYIHVDNDFFDELLNILTQENYKIIQLNENILCYPENKIIKLDLSI